MNEVEFFSATCFDSRTKKTSPGSKMRGENCTCFKTLCSYCIICVVISTCVL